MLNRDELAFQLYRDMRRKSNDAEHHRDARAAYAEADAFLAEKAAQGQHPAIGKETTMAIVKVPCNACEGNGTLSVGMSLRGNGRLAMCSQCQGTGEVSAVKQEG